MKKKLMFLLAFLTACFPILQFSSLSACAAPIGSWRAYLAYHDITEIERAGNELFVLASKNLYLYNMNDHSIRFFSKMDALSDCGISHIAWNQKAQRLIIIYENENIDLLETNGNAVNMPEYYMKSITADKTINDIYIHNQYAYISTGFGILKLDMAKCEISDTYQLNRKITAVGINNQKIYARIDNTSVMTASLSANLIDPNSWTLTNDFPHDIFDKDKSTFNDHIEILKNLSTDGPKSNFFGFLRYCNDKLYTTVGGYGAGIQQNRPGTVQVLDDKTWQIYQDDIYTITGYDYKDLLSTDVDPTDNNRVFVSGRSGVYEFNNGKYIKAYNIHNSELGSAIGPTDNNRESYTLVESVKFDNEGNLWMLNSQSQTAPIHVLYKNGTWESFKSNQLMSGNRSMGALQALTFDSRGLLWFINNHWTDPSLHFFNTQTKQVHSFSQFVNEDGTTVKVNSIQCVAEDKNGNIWVGTNVGPLMLENNNIYEDNPEFIQVKVSRNDGTNYADYLLSGVNISGIVIDGGNRKWFATKGNGIYLISADNMTQLQHFTAENSMLLSNNIESIAINDDSGEIFFGTEKGLCSYMSDASAVSEKMTKDNVYAYPNPVRPDYTGLITITGLTYDADIKIVTANGTLVAEGRSNGGIFTWDGHDQNNGKRVASGVYMVQTATSQGNKGTVCKIAIIR